jgi:hypothetical protein
MPVYKRKPELKMRLIFLSLVLLCISTPLYAQHLPPSFTAEYTIEKGFLEIGKAKRIFKRNDKGKHVYISESRTTGVIAVFLEENIVETTHFEYINGDVRPLNYTFKRKGIEDEKVTQKFDWQKHTVDSRVNGKQYNFEMVDGTLDKSVYQFSLMIDLGHHADALEYAIAERKKLKMYPIQVLGEETIDSPLGRIKTVKIRRKDKRVETVMWCAESLHYLPVKITHTENGSDFTAVLQKVKGLSPKLTSK